MQKLYKISMVVMVMIIATSCKKYLDINSNPAVPQVVKAELLLPPIQYQMTNGTSQDYRILWKINQNMGGTSSVAASLIWETQGFPIGTDVGGVIWRMTYVDLGLNLENLIKDAVENQKYEYAGIGYAIKAWAFQQCTDMYGPIGLDEAFIPAKLTFHYQDQPDVYAKVREWIGLSQKYLNMTSPLNYASTLSGVSGDYIYKGDKDKWRKFGYAVLALQYSHLVNKADFVSKYADSVTKYVDLSFANESEDATVGYTASSLSDSNPFGPQFGYIASGSTYYGRPTTTILGLLTGGVRGIATAGPTSSVDPRLSRYLPQGSTSSTTPGTTYLAITPTKGSTTTTVPIIYGNIPTGSTVYNSRYIFSDKARYALMTFGQLQFAKAEALFLKGNTLDAYTAYIAGIRANMDFINQYGQYGITPVTAAETSAYLASTEVAPNNSSLTLSDIMQQKYIAQWGWGALETWTDLRKYHYSPSIFKTYVLPPTLTLSSQNGGKLAYRIRPRYNSEYVWNAEELAKWGGLDINYMTKEQWFSLP